MNRETIDPKTIDFSREKLFSKNSTLHKADVEIADHFQIIETFIDGKLETTNVADIGDFIITGAIGERYAMHPKKFWASYKQDPTNPDRYVSTNVIRAYQVTRPVQLTAPWGELQFGDVGAWVAQRVDNPSDTYIIAQEAFAKTYQEIKQ